MAREREKSGCCGADLEKRAGLMVCAKCGRMRQFIPDNSTSYNENSSRQRMTSDFEESSVIGDRWGRQDRELDW